MELKLDRQTFHHSKSRFLRYSVGKKDLEQNLVDRCLAARLRKMENRVPRTNRNGIRKLGTTKCANVWALQPIGRKPRMHALRSLGMIRAPPLAKVTRQYVESNPFCECKLSEHLSDGSGFDKVLCFFYDSFNTCLIEGM